MSSPVPAHDDAETAAEAEAQPEISTLAATEETKSASWFEGDDADEASVSFKDYEVIASPNDFNVQTIVNFVSSGAVKIPGFQRNFVWDIKRASRLIESILIGLPIPQIFLYQEGKNSFLVVDGQQRLMSIFYFVTGRFPKAAKRPVLRRLMAEKGTLPKEIISDDTYFAKFNLQLASKGAVSASRYHGQNYETLGENRMSFDLRTIRNVVIKQSAPLEEPDTSVFEIFNRLNTGGINLRPQEIRSSLYHSDFLATLHRVNLNPVWRGITGLSDPDLHDKDVEVLLRVIALVLDGDSYAEPMSGFLNQFARKARKLPKEKIDYVQALFEAFFEKVKDIPPETFSVAKTNRFNIAAFEGIFRAMCMTAGKTGSLTIPELSAEQIQAVRSDPGFVEATQESVGRRLYVGQRLDRAKAILGF